jgi:hypothetical protein
MGTAILTFFVAIGFEREVSTEPGILSPHLYPRLNAVGDPESQIPSKSLKSGEPCRIRTCDPLIKSYTQAFSPPYASVP